jgi:hypothetical protein
VLFNRGTEKLFPWARTEVINRPPEMLLPERLSGEHPACIEGLSKSDAVSRKMGGGNVSKLRETA